MTPAVCCLLSGVLGNRTLSLRLEAAVREAGAVALPSRWLDEAAYVRHPAPRLARLSSELESELVVRRMLGNGRLPRADVYLVNGLGLALAARPLAPSARWVVATDSTPALVDRLRSGVRAGLPRRAFRALQGLRFARFVPKVDAWLPMSVTCRDSLVGDYGAAADRCAVTFAPQSTIAATPPARSPGAGPLRLLFVGNDFVRKGGPALVAARDLLGDAATLTIVSRDPACAGLADRPRIELVPGVADPRDIVRFYDAAHLLVYPTRFDLYSNVILEGLARGLPFLVSGAAATPAAELTDLTGAGWTLARADAEGIAAAARAAVADPRVYAARCEAAFAFARRELSPARFAEKVARAVGLRPS